MNSSSATVEGLIRRGYAAHQAERWADAEAAYGAALQIHPQNPVALQLLGVLRRRAGDLEQATRLMRLSLAQDSRQSHVWNNLGSALHAMGNASDALLCFEAAVRLTPDYAEAWCNRATLLFELGLNDDAATTLERSFAVTSAPTAAQWMLRARIDDARGQLRQALNALQEGVRQWPHYGPLHHNLGVLLLRLGRPADSERAHRSAMSLGVDAADAHYNLGNSLQALGRHQEALATYSEALKREPLHALTLRDIARLRWRVGDSTPDADLAQAASLHPGSASALDTWAEFLLRAGRHGEAVLRYRQALNIDSTAAHRHNAIGQALMRSGQRVEALEWMQRATALDPKRAEFKTGLAALLIELGQFEAAESQLAAAAGEAPDDQYAQALRALLTRLQPPSSAVDGLDEAEALVRAFDLPAPSGFADIEAFNEALGAALEAMHSDKRAPLDQSLRGGTQTLGDLFGIDHPLVVQLRGLIAQAVDRYIAELPTDDSHPFLRRRGKGWRFADSWSSCLLQDGYHSNHIHPHGWISSAYYVKVPNGVADTQRRAGWLRFGCTDLAVSPLPTSLRDIQPRPGLLVLFPSYFWHGTTPNPDPEMRLTVAFDVVPV